MTDSLRRPPTIRLSEPAADHLLQLLTSHAVPHRLFYEFPLSRVTVLEIPEDLRAISVRYQRQIRAAISRGIAKR